MQALAHVKSKYILFPVLMVGLWAVGCAGNIDPSLISGSAGTGGPAGSAGTTGTAPCDALGMILGNVNKCAAASACHGPTGTQGIDLMTPGVVARLVGKMPPATSTNCAASPMPYLVANSNPPMGLLLTKLMDPAPCGSPMPFAGIGGALTDADRMCINDWALAATQGRISQ